MLGFYHPWEKISFQDHHKHSLCKPHPPDHHFEQPRRHRIRTRPQRVTLGLVLEWGKHCCSCRLREASMWVGSGRAWVPPPYSCVPKLWQGQLGLRQLVVSEPCLCPSEHSSWVSPSQPSFQKKQSWLSPPPEFPLGAFFFFESCEILSIFIAKARTASGAECRGGLPVWIHSE
jgi:hypothetical protein